MIVVAIIGILAAVAIPAYQDYIVKSKLSKVVTSLDPIKTAMALYLQEQGGFPLATAADTVTTALTGTQPPAGTFWASLGFSVYPSLPAEIAQMAPANGGGTSQTSLALILELNNIKKGSIDGAYLSLSPNTNDNLSITTANNPTPTSANTTDTPTTSTVAGTSALNWYWGCAKAGNGALGFNAPNGPDAVMTNYFKNNNTPIICR